MIRIDRPADAVAGSSFEAVRDGDAASLRRHFERHAWALVPGLVGPTLLAELQDHLERAAFEQRDYDGLAGELALDHREPLVARLLFMANGPELREAVSAITGVPSLARFDGRIYRRGPRPEHYDNWHDDLAGDTRLVAMSLNLGPDAYEGGWLELRHRQTKDSLGRAINPEPGDALLFAIRPDLEHRVTSITAGTKTAFAGWFGSAPSWP